MAVITRRDLIRERNQLRDEAFKVPGPRNANSNPQLRRIFDRLDALDAALEALS